MSERKITELKLAVIDEFLNNVLELDGIVNKNPNEEGTFEWCFRMRTELKIDLENCEGKENE